MTAKPKKFNYQKAQASAKKLMDCKKLQLILLGHQGGGKSFAIGTLGVKTLYLYGTKESHGPISASSTHADNIVPICIDYGYWGDETTERRFSADESFTLLDQLLHDHEWMRDEGFGAIAVDGLPVLEAFAKDTTLWRDKCRTASGKHNTYKETEATQEILGMILGWLKAAQIELDVHIVATGILDVKEKTAEGAVVEAAPRLAGYGLAETMNQHFADIVVIGKMSRDGETKYKLQFMVDLVKTASDDKGNLKKAMNFSPRIAGFANSDLPDMMDADLAKLAKFKERK